MKVYLAPKVLNIDEMGYLPLDDLGPRADRIVQGVEKLHRGFGNYL